MKSKQEQKSNLKAILSKAYICEHSKNKYTICIGTILVVVITNNYY